MKNEKDALVKLLRLLVENRRGVNSIKISPSAGGVSVDVVLYSADCRNHDFRREVADDRQLAELSDELDAYARLLERMDVTKREANAMLGQFLKTERP